MRQGSSDSRVRGARYSIGRSHEIHKVTSGRLKPAASADLHAGLDLARFPQFTMAFQPIIDVVTGATLAQEALARDLQTHTAAPLFAKVAAEDLFVFEALCRERALQLAISYDHHTPVSLNISPASVLDPHHGLQQTFQFAERLGMSPDRLIFEFTENSVMEDVEAIRALVAPMRERGVLIALDDFGAGYNGLQTLVSMKPDIIKIDISLIRDICYCEARRVVIDGLVECCSRLDILVVAEGVETVEQVEVLQGLGIGFMQGYLLARPQIERFPVFNAARSGLVTPPTRRDADC